MEKIEFHYDMQKWHPNDPLGGEQLTHIYMRKENSDFVILMLTVKIKGSEKRIINRYVTDRYKHMENELSNMAFKTIK